MAAPLLLLLLQQRVRKEEEEEARRGGNAHTKNRDWFFATPTRTGRLWASLPIFTPHPEFEFFCAVEQDARGSACSCLTPISISHHISPQHHHLRSKRSLSQEQPNKLQLVHLAREARWHGVCGSRERAPIKAANATSSVGPSSD